MSRLVESSLVAAVDLGTNTALLLVARRRVDGAVEVVEERCETPRLGAGLAAHRTLDARARARALDVLSRFDARIQELGVERRYTRFVATACLRRAIDGPEFAALAGARLGVPLEILSESDEARLSARAIAALGAGPEALVIDVGGGSVEVACEAAHVRSSVPIGALVLTERHLASDPPTPRGIESLFREVTSACRAFPADLARGRDVFAIGGSAVGLARLAVGIGGRRLATDERARLAAGEALRFARLLAPLPIAERRLWPIEFERAAILPAGLAVLAGTLERLAASELWVSARGLRHGVVEELLEQVLSGMSGNRPSSRT